MNSRRAFLRTLAGAAAQRSQAPASGSAAAERRTGDPCAGAHGGTPASAGARLPAQALERYAGQLAGPEWGQDAQLALARASAVVVGAGALGSPVAAYLAGAGVGRLGIVDDGLVELSGLHRQHLHFTPDVGVAKAHSAAAKLGFLNPDVLVEPFQVRLDAANTPAVLAGADVVVDCSESAQTGATVNAACCDAGVALVAGSLAGFGVRVMTVLPGITACRRCALEEDPAEGPPAAAPPGILGPAAGVVGSLQALEALRLLGGLPPMLAGAVLRVDLRSPALTRMAVARRARCPDCARAPARA